MVGAGKRTMLRYVCPSIKNAVAIVNLDVRTFNEYCVYLLCHYTQLIGYIPFEDWDW